jgi:hypothetical protein
VDQSYWLKVFQDDAKKKGHAVPEGDRAYNLLSAMMMTGPAKAQRAALEGVFTISKGVERMLGPSLKSAMEKISKAEYNDFTRFLYAQHAIEVHGKGMDPGITLADAKAIYAEGSQKANFVEAAQIIKEFNDALIRMLADAGVITQEEATRIIGAYKHYVPLYRAKESKIGRFFGRGSSMGGRVLRRRRGSPLPILDPVESTFRNAILFYERASRQQVDRARTADAEADERHWGRGRGWAPQEGADRRDDGRVDQAEPGHG